MRASETSRETKSVHRASIARAEIKKRKKERTLSQFILLLLGSYVESAVSSILTINPSQLSLTLSSRNCWISSVESPSDALANANSPSTGVKLS